MRTNIGHPAYPSRPPRVITITGALLLLLPVFIGCASAPKPVTIRHAGTQSPNDAAAARTQSRAGAVDPGKQPNANPPSALAAQGQQKTADLRAAAPAEPGKQPGADLPEAISAAAPEAVVSSAATRSADTLETRAAQEQHDRELIAAIRAQVTEEVRKSLAEDVKNDVINEMYREVWKINWAMKEKDQRLRFGGDIRVRYEADYFNPNNALQAQPSNPAQLMNTTNDASRFKYRVRFGAEAKVNEQTDAVIRISTGSTSNPVSTNATMGDYMNKDSVVFDLAYIRWQPAKSLTLFGGRMPNPFNSATDLIWDTDVNFEGFAAKAKQPVGEPWSAFLTAGVFPLQQYDFSSQNKWLFGGQTGFERTDKKGVAGRIGLAYYAYQNITGVENDPLQPGATDWTAPQFMQKGNTLFNINPLATSLAEYKLALASEYKEVAVNGTLDIGFWDPVHVLLLGDYVKNIGFKKADVIARTGNPDQPVDITGYQVGISVGYPVIQDKGQWRVSLQAKRLGGDAVLDAFADSDFHLGGTNARGWILGIDAGIARNQWLTVKWLTANEISGPPLAIDVLQVDMNVRF